MFQDHRVILTGGNINGVCAANERTSQESPAVDRDRLVDENRAKAARIKHVYFAAGIGSSDRAGECLARGDAATIICVITDGRYESSVLLSVRNASQRQEKAYGKNEHEAGSQFLHWHSPLWRAFYQKRTLIAMLPRLYQKGVGYGDAVFSRSPPTGAR